MKCLQVLLVAVATLFVSTQAATLTNGWVRVLGGKYIRNTLNVTATWNDASKICKEQGYELAFIETEEEHDLFISTFADLITNRFWLAGTDLGSEGNFYWISTGESFTFSKWHAGEPSGNNPTNGIKEDCVQYWNRNGTILWNDSVCDNAYNFVCKYHDPCAKYPF